MSKNSGGVRVIDEKTSLFVIAGPIIVSGVTASVGVGLIYWLVGILK